MRLAICRVGLVSPRSTWLSIGAETPERSARSRSERSIASRSAFTRGPTAATVGSAAAAITLVRYHVRAQCARRAPSIVDAGSRSCGPHLSHPRANPLGDERSASSRRARARCRRHARRGLAARGARRDRGRRDARLPRLRVPDRHLGGLDRRRHARRRQAPRGRRARRPRMGARGRAARGDRRAGAARAARARSSAARSRAAPPAPARPRPPRSPRWRWRRRARPAGWPAPPSSAARRGPRPRSTASAATSRSSAARFDGRLRIAAVDRARGKRVMFGAPDEPKATVAEAVLASCAVPWIFAPVEIGGREYVDGGVWSPTNLDAVPAGRGTRVLALIPTAGATLAPLRTASAAAAGYESMALRAKGATGPHDRPRRPEPGGDRPRPDGPERAGRRSPRPATRRADDSHEALRPRQTLWRWPDNPGGEDAPEALHRT